MLRWAALLALAGAACGVTSWMAFTPAERYPWPRNFVFDDALHTCPLPNPWASSAVVSASNAMATRFAPFWTPAPGAAHAQVLCTAVAAVRLLSKDLDRQNDFARLENGALALVYDWTYVDETVAALVDAGLKPVLVLDNVPNDFVSPERIVQGMYGQIMGPDDDKLDLFVTAVGTLIDRLISTYTKAVVDTWVFRIGTEYDCPCHWQDTVLKAKSLHWALTNLVRSKVTAEIHFNNWAYPDSKDFADSFLAQTKNAPFTTMPLSAYVNVENGGIRDTLTAKVEATRKLMTDNGVPSVNQKRIEIQEFSIWTTGNKAPMGAFAAAANLVALAHSYDIGVSKIFHWGVLDNGPAISLMSGHAWLLNMARICVNGALMPLKSTTATTVEGIQCIHHPSFSTKNAIRYAADTEWPAGVPKIASERISVLVATLDENSRVESERELAYELELDDTPNGMFASLDDVDALLWTFDSSNSPHDILQQKAEAAGKLAVDGLAIGWRDMVGDPAFVASVRTDTNAAERSAMQPKLFDGTITKLGGKLRFVWTSKMPGASVLVLQPKAASVSPSAAAAIATATVPTGAIATAIPTPSDTSSSTQSPLSSTLDITLPSVQETTTIPTTGSETSSSTTTAEDDPIVDVPFSTATKLSLGGAMVFAGLRFVAE